MTGVLDSIRNSFSNSMLNLTNHPGQAFGKFGASFVAPGAGALLGRYYDRQNQANGTAPDQIRAQQEAQSPQATSTAFSDRLNQSLGLGPMDGGGGMTPEQMDQHILAGYTPNSPVGDYSPNAPGSADPMGLVPDYGSDNPSGGFDRGGRLSEGRNGGGNYTMASGNQLPGGGFSDQMNGASDQMRSGFGEYGDPQGKVLYHTPVPEN